MSLHSSQYPGNDCVIWVDDIQLNCTFSRFDITKLQEEAYNHITNRKLDIKPAKIHLKPPKPFIVQRAEIVRFHKPRHSVTMDIRDPKTKEVYDVPYRNWKKHLPKMSISGGVIQDDIILEIQLVGLWRRRTNGCTIKIA